MTSSAMCNATSATMLWRFMFPLRRWVWLGRGARHARLLRAVPHPARSSRFQDIALQTFARVPENGVDERSRNRADHAEREARLDRHPVGEPGAARRKLLEQVVLRKCIDERHGKRGEIKREAAVLLPAEEVLVNGAQRQPNRPCGSHAVRLVAGPSHLAHASKPSGPGFSVFEDREHLVGPGIQLHRVREAHGSRVEKRGVDGVAGKTHGSASSLACGRAVEAAAAAPTAPIATSTPATGYDFLFVPAYGPGAGTARGTCRCSSSSPRVPCAWKDRVTRRRSVLRFCAPA